MKNILRIQLLFFILIFNNSSAQSEFFHSKIQFTQDNLANIISSFSIDSTQVYFNSPDFNIQAFDKKSGVLNWSYTIFNNNIYSPKVYQNSVFVNKYYPEEEVNKCNQLNSKTGALINKLPISVIYTQPFFKGNIMYCTGENKDSDWSILAIDIKKNTILWEYIISDGAEKNPFYLSDRIIVNAGDDRWVEIKYNGKLMKNKSKIMHENRKTKKKYLSGKSKYFKLFMHLSHDNKEITETLLEDYYSEKLRYGTNDHHTFILDDTKLLILKDNLKIYREINLDTLLTTQERNSIEYKEILQINENTIWFLYKNLVVVYDYINNKTIKTTDLSAYNPHQVALDNNQIWLISKNDGQLIGLDLEPDTKTTTMIEAKAKRQSEINNCNTTDVKIIQAAKKAQEK